MARSNSTHLALVIAVLFVCLRAVDASIYPIKSRLWIPPFEHAEKMFASNLGPILARHGDSTIQVDVHGLNVTADMNEWRLVVFFYHVDSFETFQQIEDKIVLLACADEATPPMQYAGMSNAQKFVFPVRNQSVTASARYRVDVSGWTDTQILICSDANGASEVMAFEGTMEIRNPFGLLPAVLYGMLPFSALLTIGYVVLELFFATLLIKHRKQAFHLHYGILAVLTMGIAASATWSYAFYEMNKTGVPVYPYPPTFLAAVVLDTLMRTLARLLLIVVCLGYGIVRATLRRGEVALVALLSLVYFVSGIGDEVTRGTSTGAEFREKPTAWSFVQLLCNLLFIMWIHYSLEKILKQLSELKQSAKLAMYKSLAWSLAGFIVFFSALTLIAVFSRVGVFDWDVEWEWMQLVAWPVLNFIVSTAMCLIWRPTRNASQYTFSMQLPMSDAQSPGIQMPSALSRDSDDEDAMYDGDIVIDSEDDEEDEQIEVELSPHKDSIVKKESTSRTKAAPAAGEEEEERDAV